MNRVDQNELQHMLSLACAAREGARMCRIPGLSCRRHVCVASSGLYYMAATLRTQPTRRPTVPNGPPCSRQSIRARRSFDAIAIACSGDRPAYPMRRLPPGAGRVLRPGDAGHRVQRGGEAGAVHAGRPAAAIPLAGQTCYERLPIRLCLHCRLPKRRQVDAAQPSRGAEDRHLVLRPRADDAQQGDRCTDTGAYQIVFLDHAGHDQAAEPTG